MHVRFPATSVLLVRPHRQRGGLLSVAVGPNSASLTTYVSSQNVGITAGATNVGIYANTADDASSANWARSGRAARRLDHAPSGRRDRRRS